MKKNYLIGQGTACIARFTTLSEMFKFYKKMNIMNRHFCRLYDRENMRTVEGWQILHSESIDELPWEAWK